MKKYANLITVLIFSIVFIVGGIILYNGLSDDYDSQNNNIIGSDNSAYSEDSAENFTVYDVNGNKVKLSDLKGKPVVVNFWASWCPPCKNEMPDFENAYRKYGNDVQFMMVNMTDGYTETLSTAKSFINYMGYTFPVYFDTDYSAAIAYNTTALPATYFIDARGNLVTYNIGMISATDLEKGIQAIK